MTIFLERRQDEHVVKPMKVEEPIFLGIIWGCLAITIICFCLRILGRVQRFKKLLVDDYFVIAALLFVLTNAIIWQVYAHDMYYVMAVLADLELPGEGFAAITGRYFKSTVAVLILFYSALWSIKISFLFFFRRLGSNVRGQKALWWPVFIFTIAAYFVCIGTIKYSCLLGSYDQMEIDCGTEAETSLNQVTLKLNCALDVISDCAIMLIPIIMLRGVQMKWRRKAALTGIFSLVIITIIFAIIRTALVGSAKPALPDVSWLFMWSAVEASIAVIVACLATFRNLFSHESVRARMIPSKLRGSSNVFLRGNKSRNRSRDLIDTLASHSESHYQAHIESSEDSESTMHINQCHNTNDSNSPFKMPNAVHVRNDIDFYHSAQV